MLPPGKMLQRLDFVATTSAIAVQNFCQLVAFQVNFALCPSQNVQSENYIHPIISRF